MKSFDEVIGGSKVYSEWVEFQPETYTEVLTALKSGAQFYTKFFEEEELKWQTIYNSTGLAVSDIAVAAEDRYGNKDAAKSFLAAFLLTAKAKARLK